MAERIGPARARGAGRAPGANLPIKSAWRCFVQFLLFRQADRLKAHAHEQGREVDRRLALLRLSRFERRVGQSGAVSPGRTAPSALRRRRASRLFQRARDSSGAIRFTTGTLFAPTGYRWWIGRLRALLTHVDVIRLDHFRGFTAAWHVPAGAPTAQIGKLGAGSGRRFL